MLSNLAATKARSGAFAEAKGENISEAKSKLMF
jgi:hypothetical protein